MKKKSCFSLLGIAQFVDINSLYPLGIYFLYLSNGLISAISGIDLYSTVARVLTLGIVINKKIGM